MDRELRRKSDTRNREFRKNPNGGHCGGFCYRALLPCPCQLRSMLHNFSIACPSVPRMSLIPHPDRRPKSGLSNPLPALSLFSMELSRNLRVDSVSRLEPSPPLAIEDR